MELSKTLTKLCHQAGRHTATTKGNLENINSALKHLQDALTEGERELIRFEIEAAMMYLRLAKQSSERSLDSDKEDEVKYAETKSI
jgi:hypothetical protein